MARLTRPRRLARVRLAKWLLLIQLSGGCLLSASCGDQIRAAVIAGLFDFIGVTTNELLAELLPTEDLLRDLLSANESPLLQF